MHKANSFEIISFYKFINLSNPKQLKYKLLNFLEVKKFNSLKVRNDKTAYKAIGIREVNEYLQKKIEIAQVIEKISIKTRQYAKRQRTWANGNMQNWNKINPIQLTDFLKKI